MANWTEVSHAEANNRRELVLKGSEIASRIAAEGLDNRIFTLTSLNFLEMSDAGLNELPHDIGSLEKLLNLILRGNCLSKLPDSIGRLTRLQFLDASRNNLIEVPQSLGDKLGSLHTLDLSQNGLCEVPESLGNLKSLTYLNLSRNKLTSVDVVLTADLPHLSEILASHNDIASISSDMTHFEVLCTLDLSSNKLQAFPASLAQCSKLKELMLMENPVKDRRLWKLIQQERGTKPILQYIAAHGVKPEMSGSRDAKPTKDKREKRKKKASQSQEDENELVKQINVLSIKDAAEPFEVQTCKSVISVRPYIACCIVRNLDLETDSRFKQFITAQTKLHDGPLCGKRTTATIATHDLKLIKGPLTYEGKAPSSIELVPLGKRKSTTAEVLMAQLNQEAENFRKENKRNTLSGIHQYLKLLHGQKVYPCVSDAASHVISFPPITNADVSKISKSTTDILVEVTSSEDLASCKKVLEAVLSKMLELNLGSSGISSEEAGAESTSDDRSARELVVEQVRVINEEGELRVLFPSKTDLIMNGITVIR
ncbi:leucine-rich repeat-containing protein 47-like [Diadema setosum]|uniref:leucine-rich repeat-containing protein 47-like n=1 Tax=Diadema setosum TaxID=31175 RepID=UPI003B3A406D